MQHVFRVAPDDINEYDTIDVLWWAISEHLTVYAYKMPFIE